jgi:hypothetical protein
MKMQLNLVRQFLWMLLIAIAMLICAKAKAQVLPEYSAFPVASFGVQAGTQGFGLAGTWSFLPGFNARIGFNTVPDLSVDYNGRTLQLDRNSIYLAADWQPEYGKGGWFATKWFLSAGYAQYFSNNLYRQGTGTTPDYTIYMSKSRPYFGSGLSGIHLWGNLRLRMDMGWFVPTSGATSTYDDKAEKVTDGVRGLLPGLNAGATVYIKF